MNQFYSQSHLAQTLGTTPHQISIWEAKGKFRHDAESMHGYFLYSKSLADEIIKKYSKKKSEKSIVL